MMVCYGSIAPYPFRFGHTMNMLIARLLALLLLVAATGPSAQYPAKPIRLIFTSRYLVFHSRSTLALRWL
jgi:hypothetical protein